MRHVDAKTQEWKVFIETTYERPDDFGEVRVGDPVLLNDSAGRPLVARVTEVHDESGTLMVEFYNEP